MSVQDIFAQDPLQQELDERARRHARLYLAAFKAATAIVDEINRAEPLPPPPPEEPGGEEPKPDEGTQGEEEEEEEESATLLGLDEAVSIAAKIYEVMANHALLSGKMPGGDGAPARPEASPAAGAPATPGPGRRVPVGGPRAKE